MGTIKLSKLTWTEKKELMLARKKLVYLKNPKSKILPVMAARKIIFLRLLLALVTVQDNIEPRAKLKSTENVSTTVKKIFHKDMNKREEARSVSRAQKADVYLCKRKYNKATSGKNMKINEQELKSTNLSLNINKNIKPV